MLGYGPRDRPAVDVVSGKVESASSGVTKSPYPYSPAAIRAGAWALLDSITDSDGLYPGEGFVTLDRIVRLILNAVDQTEKAKNPQYYACCSSPGGEALR